MSTTGWGICYPHRLLKRLIRIVLYSQAVISISGITAFYIPLANSRFDVESMCHFEQKKICTPSAKVAQGLLTDNIQKPSALPSKSDLLEKNNTRNA